MYYLGFGGYFLAFMLVESMVNQQAAKIISPEAVNWVYIVGLLFTALGYTLFGLFNKKIKKTYMLWLVSFIAVLGTLFLITTANAKILIIAAFCSLISYGYLGGYIHRRLGSIIDRARFSVILGITFATAILIQAILDSLAYKKLPFAIVVLFSLVFILICSKKENYAEGNNHEEMPNEIPNSENISVLGTKNISRGLLLVILVSLMSIILGLQDSIVVAKNANSEIALFSGIRLFYALGLLLAGFVSYYKDRLYLPLTTMCAMLLSVAATAFMIRIEDINLSMGLMYFYSGFYVMFLTIMFISYGSDSIKPDLWCGMGRIVRSLVTAITVLVSVLMGELLSVEILIIVTCILAIVNILCFVAGGLLPFYNKYDDGQTVFYKEKSANDDIVNGDNLNDDISASNKDRGISCPTDNVETLAIDTDTKSKIFAEKYNLTSREMEVLVILMETDKGVQEIADEIGISRRTLQKHIASIYDKTNTNTRLGVYRLWN